MRVTDKWTVKALRDAGIIFSTQDGVTTFSDPVLASSIIDNFDPLPHAKAEAMQEIEAAATNKRRLYVTDSPGKDAEYEQKRQEARDYVTDATIGPWMQARVDRTGESAVDVANEWNVRAGQWIAIGASIATSVDYSTIRLNAVTDWQQCKQIVTETITEIEAI